MADLWGQIESGLSGGSDKWDDGLAGSILLADYFAAAAAGLTLSADVGAFALTGGAAALRFGRRLSAEAGSFALSGVAVSGGARPRQISTRKR